MVLTGSLDDLTLDVDHDATKELRASRRTVSHPPRNLRVRFASDPLNGRWIAALRAAMTVVFSTREMHDDHQ